MDRSFESEACSLAHAFSTGTSYIIPEYQREYVWGEREVEKLLEDVEGQYGSDPNHDYFIGTTLVAEVKGQKRYGRAYEVIDGQQRLTTLFLTICAARNLFKKRKIEEHITWAEKWLYETRRTTGTKLEKNLKLILGYDNADSLIRNILQLDENPATVPPSTSIKNLNSAYSLIYTHLTNNYVEDEAFLDFFNYLIERVVFIRITTTYSNALTIFETINERGIGLDPMDLLKNLLFKQVSREEFPRIKDLWSQFVQPLQKAKENPLQFLRYFIMANYPMKRPASTSEDAYDWLINEENAALCGYVEDPYSFLAKIKKNADAYLNLTQSKYKDGSDCLPLKNLHELTPKSTRIHLVLLLAGLDLPRELFEHLVTQLEAYFSHYIFTGFTGFTGFTQRVFEVSFSQWATPLRKIAKGLNPQDELNKFCQVCFGHHRKSL